MQQYSVYEHTENKTEWDWSWMQEKVMRMNAETEDKVKTGNEDVAI